MASFRAIAFLALTTGFASIANAQASGSGTTTRYWDCCKGSCSWSGKADVSNPVTTCDIDDTPLTDSNAVSGCESGGTAFMCSDQSPWAANDTLAFGFAAVNIAGGSESSWCCACYKLTFTSTSLATSGKTMIVQATNTGGDLGSNQFDLAMPGGGVGIYNGCTDEWGAPSSGWGAQYGGISTDTCSTFPTALQSGCGFRFDWFEGADNPSVDFEQVTCPSELTAKTNCVRDGETPFAYASASTSSASANVAAVVASSSSSSSVEASVAPTSSSAAAESFTAAVSTSAAAATSASSSAVAPVETSSSAAAASPVAFSAAASSSASSSNYVAPASSSVVSYSTGGYIPGASSAASSSSTAAAAQSSAPAAADDDASCNVQYVYEYDL